MCSSFTCMAQIPTITDWKLRQKMDISVTNSFLTRTHLHVRKLQSVQTSPLCATPLLLSSCGLPSDPSVVRGRAAAPHPYVCVSAGSGCVCDASAGNETACQSGGPGCPLKARPGADKVPQMACEVYIHCPLLNRLALMKCLMPGPRLT